MLIIELSLIIVFAFILRFIFLYLQRNIEQLGPGQNVVITIIMIVMLFNIILMVGIVLYSSYHTEWRALGSIGLPGPDGPPGDIGPPNCIKKGSPIQVSDCPKKQ